MPLAKELILESENEVGDFLMDRNRKLSPPPRKKSPKCKYADSKCQLGNATEGPVRGEPGEAGGLQLRPLEEAVGRPARG